MSLYDSTDVKVKPISGSSDGDRGNWSNSGLKLLQEQVRLKKAALNQRDRSKQSSSSTLSSVAPVFDLSGRKRKNDDGTVPKPSIVSKPSLLKVRKPLALDGAPLSFLPFGAKKEERVNMFGEINVEEEYNPLVPNEFHAVKLRLEADKARIKAMEKARVAEEKDRTLIARQEDMDRVEEESETKKRSQGAAIAPPSNLVESDKRMLAVPEPESSLSKPPALSVLKGLGVAAKYMHKYGFKQGGGLGRDRQGISTALHVEKVGFRSGKIICEDNRDGDDSYSGSPNINMPPPLSEEPAPITQVLKNPTKVIVLRNMVGADDVDDELEPEIKEEMVKYGDVTKVVIFKMPPPVADNEAMRIFVEFPKIDQAIKAVVDLNGRFFGGRHIQASFYDVDKFSAFTLADSIS